MTIGPTDAGKSDTPRTDVAIAQYGIDVFEFAGSLIAFARSLERELARKQAVIDELVAARDAFNPNELNLRNYDERVLRVENAWSAARREATAKGET